jgi:hypothetical protein
MTIANKQSRIRVFEYFERTIFEMFEFEFEFEYRLNFDCSVFRYSSIFDQLQLLAFMCRIYCVYSALEFDACA